MNKFRKSLVLIIVIALVSTTFAFVGCSKPKTDESKTYVSMDINPSVELVVGSDGKVVSFVAKNEDAQVMLYAEEGILNCSIEDATSKILDLSVECGYLTEENNGVGISVVSSNSKSEEDITNKINTTVTTSKINSTISLSCTSITNFAISRKLKELKEEKPEIYGNCTEAKLELAINACVYDKTLTLDAAVQLDVAELINRIETGENTVVEYATEAYNYAVEVANAVYEKVVLTSDFAIYNEKYLETIANKSSLSLIEKATLTANVVKYVTSVTAAETLRYSLIVADKIGEVEISEENANNIAGELGVDVSVLQNKDGVVTVQSVENYIDKALKNSASDVKNTIVSKMNVLEDSLNAAEASAIENELQSDAELYATLTNAVSVASSFITGIQISENPTIDDMKLVLTKLDESNVSLKEELDSKLTEEELAAIASSQTQAREQLSSAYSTLTSTVESAKNTAMDYLAQKKAERKTNVA